MPCFLTRYVAVKSVKCSHCMGVHGANGRFTCFIYSCPCFVFSALQLLWIESKRGHSLFLNFLLLIDWTSFFRIYYIMAPTKPSGITQMVTRMRAAANPPKTVAENNSLVNKKRKADTALTSENKKRSALGDLTNVKNPLWFHISFHCFIYCCHFIRLLVSSLMPKRLSKERCLPLSTVTWQDLNWLALQLKHLPWT